LRAVEREDLSRGVLKRAASSPILLVGGNEGEKIGIDRILGRDNTREGKKEKRGEKETLPLRKKTKKAKCGCSRCRSGDHERGKKKGRTRSMGVGGASPVRKGEKKQAEKFCSATRPDAKKSLGDRQNERKGTVQSRQRTPWGKGGEKRTSICAEKKDTTIEKGSGRSPRPPHATEEGGKKGHPRSPSERKPPSLDRKENVIRSFLLFRGFRREKREEGSRQRGGFFLPSQRKGGESQRRPGKKRVEA